MPESSKKYKKTAKAADIGKRLISLFNNTKPAFQHYSPQQIKKT